MIMGVETEFGMVDGTSSEKARAVQDEVLKSMPYIKANHRGAFLANGGRAYVDAGAQNEYCTPEANDPAELVVHEMAGRELMAKAAAEAGYSLLCTNVDPVHGTTWGSHENYSSKRRITKSTGIQSLFIHLATRLPYTGAGGMSLSATGINMEISPRASFIRQSRCRQGTNCRSLLFDKISDHGQDHRNHLICGESLLCHYADYLKYATTALVVAAIDARLPLFSTGFSKPLMWVLGQVNRDLDMARLYELEDGRRFTVLDVQEALAESMENHLHRLPDWAPLAVTRWRRVLLDLREGNERLSKRIDWLLYRRLLLQLASEMDLDADMLRDGNRLLATQEERAFPHPDMRCLTEYRYAAIELYIRLHILGDDSLFRTLESKDWVNHRLSEISPESILDAQIHPPSGRAAKRAALICRYHLEPKISMNWGSFIDKRKNDSGLKLTISSMAPSDIHDAGQDPEDEESIEFARHLYRTGYFGECVEELEGVYCHSTSRLSRKYAGCLCSSHARIGRADTALALLRKMQAWFTGPLEYLACSLFCAMHEGIGQASPRIDVLTEQIKQRLGQGIHSPRNIDLCIVLQGECSVSNLLREESPAEAEQICRHVLSIAESRKWNPSTARVRCRLAKALLMQGKRAKARRELETAIDKMARQDLYAELATLAYPLLARMEPDTRAARQILYKAETLLRRRTNPLGLAEVLSIKSRRLGIDCDHWEITQLRRNCDSLTDCSVLKRILDNWDAWYQVEAASPETDYWGL